MREGTPHHCRAFTHFPLLRGGEQGEDVLTNLKSKIMLIQEKIRQAAELLKEFNIDCWITFTRETVINGDPILPFLVDGDLTWHSALIVTRSGETCAIVGRYDKQGVDDLKVYSTVVGYVEGCASPLQDFLRRVNPGSIAVNYSRDSEICDGLTHGMYLTLLEILAEIGMDKRLVSAEPILSALRERKSSDELDRIREAITRTQLILAEVSAFIAPGRTEREVAAFMREQTVRAKVSPAWDERMCPAVFTGPDTAEAHYGPTDRKIEEGHILNIDFGLKVNEYCSDLQRTWYILKKGEVTAPPEVQRGFNTIVRSIEESRKGMRPGIEGAKIDAIARGVVTSGGYAEFPHALGHQVGRFAHDGTALLGPLWEKYGKKPLAPLEEGMVFTLEPRLTVKDRGIATIEEMVVVTAEGAEFLSTPQKDIWLAKKS
jgi:Xaa-Pro aminopeptidase